MNKTISDIELQTIFDSIGNDINSWCWKSLALLLSADAVENSCGRIPNEPNNVEEVFKWVEVHGITRMLRGVAIECMFKALWLEYGGSLVNKGKYKGIPGAKDHDLCSLESKVAEKVNTGLNIKEKRLLARLSFFIENGRYPIRKSYFSKYPSYPYSDKPIKWYLWTQEHNKIFDNLVCAVKRRWFSAGSRPVRQLVVPAGSNRDGSGSNETVGAFDVEAA